MLGLAAIGATPLGSLVLAGPNGTTIQVFYYSI